MKTLIKISLLLLSTLLSAALLSGCGRHEYKERSGFFFDTYITVRAYETDDETLDGALALCRKYDDLFSRTSETGDVWRINHSSGQAVEVADETAELLRLSLYYAELSGGKFDITCGSVTSLWDFSAEQPSVPQADELAEALKYVGADRLSIDGNTVMAEQETQVDLGGIAKGYIADRLADYLRSRNVENAVINLGGNVIVLGDKYGEQYNVGVQSPFDDSYIGSLRVSDCSVVTAGTYQRGFESDGTYYHHILDLSTGMPADTGLEAVTVVTESSADGDALATLLFLLGEDEGMRLAQSLNGTEALFVSSNGTVTTTDGLTLICG